jgi:hypothetical protein
MVEMDRCSGGGLPPDKQRCHTHGSQHKMTEGGLKLFSWLSLQDICNSASWYLTKYRCCRGQPQNCIGWSVGVERQFSRLGWEVIPSDAFPDTSTGVGNLYAASRVSEPGWFDLQGRFC